MSDKLKPLPSCWTISASHRPFGWYAMVLNNGCLLAEGFSSASEDEARHNALVNVQSKIKG